MLQQTTVAAVAPYYESFLTRFPELEALAAAPEEAVMPPGPGSATTPAPATCTPAPARSRRPGGFPRDVEGLRALPGIGAYTAAAVAAIAFGQPVVPVDGNVTRVVARARGIEEPLPAAQAAIAAAAEALGWPRRPAHGRAISPRRCSISAPRSARPRPPPARSARARAAARVVRAASPRTCRARRRSRSGRCATACISGWSTGAATCCCAAAPRAACSAA